MRGPLGGRQTGILRAGALMSPIWSEAGRAPRLNHAACIPLLFLVVTSLLGVAGCKIERQYTRIQTEDGLGMKAPITRSVRVKVNTASKSVTWMQDLRDSRGVEARNVTEYGANGVGTCDIFDEYNWSCSFAPTGKVVEAPAMKDGQLSRFYWVGTETYRTTYRVLGITVPLP